MFLPIRECINDVFHELVQLRVDTEFTKSWAKSFEYHLGKAIGREVKWARAQSVKSVRDEDWQTALQRQS